LRRKPSEAAGRQVCYNPERLIVTPESQNPGGVMSGPIVRKYGFPNHEAIFGKRPLEHGVEADRDEKAAEEKAEPKSPAKPKSKGKAEPKAKK
jgi:hypothetical protein